MTNKDSEKKHTKNIKIALKKKKEKSKKGKYQKLTKGEKVEKIQYHYECNKNLPEKQMQKLVEYREIYYITHNK